MVNWHLSKQGICWSVSCDHIVGSSLELTEVMCAFLSWPLTKCWLLIGLQAHVRLTCCKQGWVVQKPVNCHPGLKVDWSINISLYKCLQCTENLTAKLQNLRWLHRVILFGVSRVSVMFWMPFSRSFLHPVLKILFYYHFGFSFNFLEITSVKSCRIFTALGILRDMNFKHEKSRVCTNSFFDSCKFMSFTAVKKLVS